MMQIKNIFIFIIILKRLNYGNKDRNRINNNF